MTRFASAWCGLLAFAMSGCLSSAAAPESNRCGGDGDCLEGVCDPAGLCRALEGTPRDVVLEVLPSRDAYAGDPVAWSFPPRTVEGAATVDLVAPLPAAVGGRVVQGDEPVTAELSFTPLTLRFDGEVLTRRVVQTTATSAERNFTTQLQPGRAYRVSVTPTGAWRARVPPLRLDVEVPEDANVASFIDIAYPEDLRRIEGTVVDAEGHPRDGVVVRVIEVSDGRLVSSTYVTGSDEGQEPGYFELFLAQEALDWTLQISAVDGGALPTFQVGADFLPVEDDRITVLTPSTESRTVTYTAVVEGRVEDPDGTRDQPVVGAEVVLRSSAIEDTATGVVGTYERTVTTDAQGRFEALILPGEYTVTITPREGELSSIVETISIQRTEGGAVQGQLFVLPSRARLGGSILTPDGMPMPGAALRAEPRLGTGIGDADFQGAAALAQAAHATTDGDGSFELRLDLGVYDLFVEPPAGLGYPVRLLADRTVHPERVDGNESIVLGLPQVVDGVAFQRLEDGRTVPIVGEVVAHLLIATPTGGRRAVEVARTVVSDDGTYRMLLPSL
jgi:hypothetical protein